MKIGIFDSGLGGLIVTKAIRKAMPQYDYVYLGDTKRVPYGNRSHETVFEFTRQAVSYLFREENCGIVIVACNTASARALRKIQQEYLLASFPDRKVLGVLIPTAEECANYNRVGIIGTTGTVSSGTFPNEINKINQTKNCEQFRPNSKSFRKTKVFQNPAPMLVLLAEEGERARAIPFIKEYLKPLLSKKPDAIALGCTHYPFYKDEIRKIVGKKVTVLSQDEIIPKKLKEYFALHPEIEKNLAKNGKTKILLTDITKNIEKLTLKWFGKNTKPEYIKL